MKKLKKIMVIVTIVFCSQVNAQQLDLGMSFVPTAYTVNFDMKKFSVPLVLLAHANFSTKKSYLCLPITLIQMLFLPFTDGYINLTRMSILFFQRIL